jgi:hypothetical protein
MSMRAEKEVVEGYFKCTITVILLHGVESHEKTQNSQSPGRDTNEELLKHETDTLITRPLPWHYAILLLAMEAKTFYNEFHKTAQLAIKSFFLY